MRTPPPYGIRRRPLLAATVLGSLLAGRSARASGAARRLVAIGPGALRFVTYLGAEDQLVALEDVERKPMSGSSYRLALGQRRPGLNTLPSLGPGGPGRLPDPELLLAARAELAVTVTLDGQQQQTLRERAGLQVLALGYGDTGVLQEDVVLGSIQKLGDALGRQLRARALAGFIRGSLADLKARVGALAPAPAYLGGVSLSGGQALTSTQARHAPLVWAAASSLADTGGASVRSAHLFIDREQLLAWDPPVIFVDGGGLAMLLASHAKDPSFHNRLRAVRERRLYLTLPYNAYNTNVEHSLINAWFIAKLLHPAALADVDFRRRQAEIFDAFLGRDVSDGLAQQGLGCGRLDLASGQWTPLWP